MNRQSNNKTADVIKLKEENENLRNEVGALRQSVNSKTAAINILRTELQECQGEREKLQSISNHRPSTTTPVKDLLSQTAPTSVLGSTVDISLAQLLSIAKEENYSLKEDLRQLRCRLHDAQADLKVLRQEKQAPSSRYTSPSSATFSQLCQQEREQFLSKIEAANSKCRELEASVQGLIAEKDELLSEREDNTSKIHRLNHMLMVVINKNCKPEGHEGGVTGASESGPARVPDIDSIISENRYLQQRLVQLENEKVLAQNYTSKYKAALDNCNKKKGAVKLGVGQNLIVTPKQVRDMISQYKEEVTGPAEGDMRSLCVALVDTLNQRSHAVKTYKTANKMLLDRIAELEKRPSDCHTTASSVFLHGYITPSNDTIAEPIPNLDEILSTISPHTRSPLKETSNPNQLNEGSPNRTTPITNSESSSNRTSSLSNNESSQNEPNVSSSPNESEEGNPSSLTNKTEGSLSSKENNKLHVHHSKENFNYRETCINAGSVPESGNVIGRRIQQTEFKNVNHDDIAEEIVPLDEFDLYMKAVRESNKIKNVERNKVKDDKLDLNSIITDHSTSAPNTTDVTVPQAKENVLAKPNPQTEEVVSDSEGSLSLSEYESDDDALEATLNDWQKSLGPLSPKKNSSDNPKGISKLWKKKNKSKSDEPSLQDVLEQTN